MSEATRDALHTGAGWREGELEEELEYYQAFSFTAFRAAGSRARTKDLQFAFTVRPACTPGSARGVCRTCTAKLGPACGPLTYPPCPRLFQSTSTLDRLEAAHRILEADRQRLQAIGRATETLLAKL